MAFDNRDFDLSCDLVGSATKVHRECPHKEIIVTKGDVVLTGKMGNALFSYNTNSGAIEIDLEYLERV